jgi:hypothetical protein
MKRPIIARDDGQKRSHWPGCFAGAADAGEPRGKWSEPGGGQPCSPRHNTQLTTEVSQKLPIKFILSVSLKKQCSRSWPILNQDLYIFVVLDLIYLFLEFFSRFFLHFLNSLFSTALSAAPQIPLLDYF